MAEDARLSGPYASLDSTGKVPLVQLGGSPDLTDTTKFLRDDRTWAAPVSAFPSGAAGGALDGTYPNPGIAAAVAGAGLAETSDVLSVNVDASTIEINADTLRVKALGITDSHVAAANKDGAAGTASMRTLSTTSTTACAGNDSRLSDARTPSAHHTSHEAGGSDILTNLAAPTGGGATFVVAASNAHTRIKQQADYICDGTADDVEINAAIAAAGTGKVRLTEGTFNITAPILIQTDCAVLEGSGTGQSNTNTSGSNLATTRLVAISGLTTNMILVQGAANTRPVNGVILRDFVCDGVSLAGPIDGIMFRSHQALIDNVHCYRFSGNGLIVKGYTWSTYNTRLFAVCCGSNTLAGILIDTNGEDLHLTNCISHSNTGNGIDFAATTSSAQLTGCHVYSNAIGIHLASGGHKIVNCKIEVNNTGGIYADTTAVGYLTIVGCGFKSNSQTTDNTTDNINLSPSTSAGGHVIAGNAHLHVSGNKARYAVYLSSNVTNSIVSANSSTDSTLGTARISDNGTTNSIDGRVALGATYRTITGGTTSGVCIGAGATDKVGMFGVTPVVQSSAYTVTNTTTDRTYDANATSLDEIADILGTLIADLRLIGVVG